MDRRRFNSLCTGLIAGAVSAHANVLASTTPYPKSQLVYADGSAVTLSSLPSESPSFSVTPTSRLPVLSQATQSRSS